MCGEKSEWRSVDIVKSVGEDGGDEEECVRRASRWSGERGGREECNGM